MCSGLDFDQKYILSCLLWREGGAKRCSTNRGTSSLPAFGQADLNISYLGFPWARGAVMNIVYSGSARAPFERLSGADLFVCPCWSRLIGGSTCRPCILASAIQGPPSRVLVTSRRRQGLVRNCNYCALSQNDGVVCVICALKIMLFSVNMCRRTDISALRLSMWDSKIQMRTDVRKLGVNQAARVPTLTARGGLDMCTEKAQPSPRSRIFRALLRALELVAAPQFRPWGLRMFLSGPYTAPKPGARTRPWYLSGPHHPQEV